MYVSWNGATDVRRWKFYGHDVADGAFVLLVEIEKSGFETSTRAKDFVRYTYVEAIAEDGEILERSKIVKTRVPPVVFSRGCSEDMCPDTLRWEDASDACTCEGESRATMQSQKTLHNMMHIEHNYSKP